MFICCFFKQNMDLSDKVRWRRLVVVKSVSIAVFSLVPLRGSSDRLTFVLFFSVLNANTRVSLSRFFVTVTGRLLQQSVEGAEGEVSEEPRLLASCQPAVHPPGQPGAPGVFPGDAVQPTHGLGGRVSIVFTASQCACYESLRGSFFCVCVSRLDLDEMENISPFRKRCIIPVLGLIENSLYENSLVHNILCMLLQLINAGPKLADILLDHGLLYVLFNTLSTLNGMENGYDCQAKEGLLVAFELSRKFSLCSSFRWSIWLPVLLLFSSSLCSIPLNDYKLLVCDIQQMLVAVTIHSCSSSGSQYFRIIEDLITLLGFMQTSKMRRTRGEFSRLSSGRLVLPRPAVTSVQPQMETHNKHHLHF